MWYALAGSGKRAKAVLDGLIASATVSVTARIVVAAQPFHLNGSCFGSARSTRRIAS
jgi:hypothetical protein